MEHDHDSNYKKVVLMQRLILLALSIAYLSGCSLPGGGLTDAQGHPMHYHTNWEDFHFVVYTDIPSDTRVMEQHLENLLITGARWKGHIHGQGLPPVDYHSGRHTLELCGEDYALNEGRIYLVAIGTGQSSPVVTQIKLSAEEEKAFAEAWQCSKHKGLAVLENIPSVSAFLSTPEPSAAKQ